MSEKQYNPKDRIKNHLKRKSSSRTLFSPSVSSPAVNFENLERENNTESCPAPLNPFKIQSPQKKRRAHQVTFSDDSENANDSFGANIRKPLSPQKTPTKGVRSSPRKKKNTQLERFTSFDPTLLQEFHAVDFSQLLPTASIPLKPAEPVQESTPDLPIDLRLGGKLRLVSKVPFPWMNTRKSTGIVSVRIPAIDRYEGVRYFNRMYISGQEDPTAYLPSSTLSLLEAATLYYQFPVIPGMAMYPRITSEIRNVTRVPLAQPTTNTMFNQWVECYEQLFMSYKKGERDHFYVASAVFNVLFTKTTVTDDSDGVTESVCADETSQSCFKAFSGQKLVALVSYTNSATREHLRSQGVDYEVIGALPKSNLKRSSSQFLLNQNTSTLDCLMSTAESRENSMTGSIDLEKSEKSAENSLKSPEKREESSDENDSPTKANQEWLNDIGVSPRHVKGNARRKLSTQLSKNEGGISCLLVRGAAVQSLYNTLMSSDIVHEKTGPFTKIPPTLIATSPFLYGQLISMNKSSQIISKAGSKCSEYVLELDGGPVLPHCTKMVLH
ncbi:hypothetical protein CRE_04392 [Caenorhabditis remanei]|uniref:Uncharacterized protein n=1 Tax=Caenorhabditis remanei TaxID=31234 RepID=E3NLI3_CAERE|nr:hypothetical protein CRE_04392 [Caenorhabditis remanei]